MKLNRLIIEVGIFMTLFPICIWGDESIVLTPTTSPNPTPIQWVHRIVIDPGNGGKDFGAVSSDKKLVEKDVNIKVSKKVAALLSQQPGLEVWLTRQGDDDVSEKERANFANSHNADLFISIHCGQSLDEVNEEHEIKSGTIIYVYDANPPTSTLSVDQLKNFMEILKQNNFWTLSCFLAEKIQRLINDRLKQPLRQIQEVSFYVLTQVNMPSLWIRVADITNKDEARKLGNPQWQDKMAKAIADGILAYRTQVEGNFEPQAKPRETEIKLNPQK